MDPEQFLVRQPWSKLEPVLASVTQPARALERIKAYSNLLMSWNRGVSNLISHNDEQRFVERHLLESLAPAELIRAASLERFVDLGSGGGLPAIPLILASVGRHWVLVESRRNKTLFLRRVEQDLELKELGVKTGRLETLLETEPETLACDGFTSRATLPLGPTLEMAARIVRAGGKAFLWKGSSWQSELDESREVWARAWEFEQSLTLDAGPAVVVVMLKK